MSGTLFESGSVFNAPFGPDAQWGKNSQLSGGQFYLNVNTADGTGFNQTLYWASPSDPVVTVTGTSNWTGANNGPIQVHIPAGAEPAVGSDSQLSVVNDGTLYSFGNFSWTGSNTATATYTAIENASGSGVIDAPSGQFDGSDYDFAVGAISASDLTAAQNTGSIDHMLRVSIPTNLAESVSSNWQQLASYAGPQTEEDGFGPQQYTGTLPYGVTMGIPKGVAEPADIKANAGANILWNTLQNQGAMVRDTDGTGNNIALYADQGVSASNPLIQGMNQYGSEIETYLEVLTNQGSTLVNGNPGANWVANATSGSGSGSGTGTGSGSGTGGTGTGSGSGGTASPNETVITPGSGSFTDGNDNTYTITAGGAIDDNGTAVAGGAGTSEGEWYNSTPYFEDGSTNTWYTYSGGASGTFTQVSSAPPGSSGSSGSGSGTGTGSGGSTGGFTTQNGQIIGPDGKVFNPRGLDIGSDTLSQAVANSSANPLLQDFPGTNFIRLACTLNDTPQSIQQAVNWATSQGIVVEIEYHLYPQGLVDNQTVDNWYTAMASAFKGNPLVWYGTENEPTVSSGNGISTMQTNQYNAIRNAGATSPIMMDQNGAAGPTPGETASAYSSMSNIIWDAHAYNWVSNYSTNQSTVNAAVANEIATQQNFATSADGKIPVIIGEYGNSTGGTNIDAGWQQLVTAVQGSSAAGAIAWAWNPTGTTDNTTGANDVFNNDNPADGLSTYGQDVASYIAAGQGTSVSGSGSGSSGSGTGSGGTESPNGTTDVPGSGSITDANGNVYTLQASTGTPLENGKAMAGGVASDEQYYYNHTLYDQATGGQWYDWSGTAFATTGTPPGLTSGGGGSEASPSGTVIVPGGGTITDNSGNLYVLTTGNVAEENGNPISGGSNTAQMEFYNGQVYGQDATSSAWSTWNGTYWVSASAPPADVNISSAPSGAITENVSDESILGTFASGTHHALTLNGSNNVVNLTGGAESITETSGSGNNIIAIPPASAGTLTLQSSVASNGDIFDLRQALAGTQWTGSASTLGNFISVRDVSGNTNVIVDPTGAAGAGTLTAVIDGASITPTNFFAHALT